MSIAVSFELQTRTYIVTDEQKPVATVPEAFLNGGSLNTKKLGVEGTVRAITTAFTNAKDATPKGLEDWKNKAYRQLGIFDNAVSHAPTAAAS